MILSGVVAFVLKSVYAYLKYFKNVEMIGIWSHFHDYSHMVGGLVYNDIIVGDIIQSTTTEDCKFL